MGDHERVLALVFSGRSDANIRFADLAQLLARLGFASRIRGDHHIFSKSGLPEIINLQPKGSNAKPYQVRQVRSLITSHHLGLDDSD